MFGRNWEPGQATIVALKEVWSAGRYGGMDYGSGDKIKTYEFVADVHPTGGGPVFRTVMHEPFDERVWSRPSVGHVVPVKCDPRRQQAKFDTSVDADRAQTQKAQQQAAKKQQAAQFDAAVKAAPGSSGSTIPGSGHRDDQLDPQVRRARVALREARRSGDPAEVERLTAELEQLEHGNAHARSQLGNTPGGESIEQRLAAASGLRSCQKLARPERP